MRPTTIGTFALAISLTAVLTGCPRDNADGRGVMTLTFTTPLERSFHS